MAVCRSSELSRYCDLDSRRPSHGFLGGEKVALLETLNRLTDELVPDGPEKVTWIDHDNEYLTELILRTVQLPHPVPGVTVIVEQHTGITR